MNTPIDRGLMNRRFMNRALAMQAVLVAASAMAFAAAAETASPQSFVEGIYKHYLGKESNGLPLSSDAVIRRYFAPPLAEAIIKDFAAAAKAGEVPLLNGDPFVDAQDWEIASLETAVKSTGANTAIATVSFTMFMEPRTVTLALVTTPAGWRIGDIRWPRGSLRAVYKLK
ncbi:MAG: YbjP/YqhG family protein [Xanthobacteraceae bacterium]|nr:YbjP/YqhG family protein [Xanthobacteraceae bacterium]